MNYLLIKLNERVKSTHEDFISYKLAEQEWNKLFSLL